MMDGLQPILAVVLLAIAVAALVSLAAHRAAEQTRRARLLRRLVRVGAVGASDVAAPAEIIRRSGRHDRWWLEVARHAPVLRGSGPLLEQAGLDWSSAAFARLSTAFGAGGALVGFVLGGSFLAAAAGFALGLLLPSLYLRRRKAQRLAQIEEQLPETIDLLSRAIRAGHALNTALRMVADESPDPLASELRRVFEEQKFGLRFEDSLRQLTRRVDLLDIRVLVVAILVQREVGGNLSEILDNISQLIRSRFMLRRQVQVFTAQGRMSGWVLGALPIALGLVIQLVNPKYIQVLFTDPAGRMLLAVGFMLQLTGYFWISRVLKIDP